MKEHWKILLWMLAGLLTGVALQLFSEGRPEAGLALRAEQDHALIREASALARKSGLAPQTRLWAVVRDKGGPDEARSPVRAQQDLDAVVAEVGIGDVLFFEVGETAEEARRNPKPLSVVLAENSARRWWVDVFGFGAELFLALLKMLIVPLVLTSIVSGVAGVSGGRELRRLGLRTFGYYVATSLLAIFVGLSLVNLIQPGVGVQLGLPYDPAFAGQRSENFLQVLQRMIPTNLFQALGSNGDMLQVIFFGLLFGACITLAPDPHRTRMREFFDAAFGVMMKLAELVLKLLPYGVFCLIASKVAETGFGVFAALGWYMLTVVLALLVHACLTLPLVLRFLARVSPWRWARAMSPALFTAFSTSSSGMTLPVTLESVEKRGGVSNRTSSFVLPLGATINMDGTALYECVGVLFLAQYYAGIGAHSLGFGDQCMVVLLALLASVGAAAIPSAGLVMMLTILSAMRLPLEGAFWLLAVDRPLDMLRTTVNVWSDTCGCAFVARGEGEALLGEGGADPGGGLRPDPRP
ncbi:MAG: dicarboxylate/amino acid:cation symporter [Planctomycetota bacterium]